MKAKRQVSITTALVLDIALVTAVVGLFCAWLVARMASEDLYQRESEYLQEAAQHIGVQIASAMRERYAEVRLVRDGLEQELAAASEADKRGVLNRLRDNDRYFSWVGIVDAQGAIRIASGKLLEGMSVAGRNWFEGAMTSPHFFGNVHPAKLLQPHIRNDDGAPLYLLDISLPLRDAQGAPRGVLGTHMNWRMIEDLVRQSLRVRRDNSGFSAAIVSADGVILYDTQGATGSVQATLQGESAHGLRRGLWPQEGEDSILVVATVPAVDVFSGLGWKIVVRTSASRLEGAVSELRRNVLIGSVLAGLVLIALGMLAVRTVTRPLSQLTEEIASFGDTGILPGTVAAEHLREIRSLHGAFLGMAAKVAMQNEMLRDTQHEIVRALGRAGEFRDNETGYHVLRMSLCCGQLGRLAGLSEADAEQLTLAAQMHDIGKIGIPDHILLKPGRFEPHERAVIEKHPEIGAKILTGLDSPLLTLARTIALSHHEKWDGSGYPEGLRGDAIPLSARITAICDVFDALLSSRPYKPAWSLERVVALYQAEAGKHFDPALVQLFLTHLDDFLAIRNRLQDAPDDAVGQGQLIDA